VPFEGEAPVSIALKQVSEIPVPPAQLEPSIPPALEAVVMRALEKDPDHRFQDADEFIAALENARRVPTRQVVLEPTPGEPWEPVEERGSRWWIWLLVLLLIAAAAAGAYFLLGGGKRVEVPSVKGKTFGQAAQTLHARGLEVTPVNEVSDTVAPGRVISQDPAAGSKVKDGSTVTVKVSAGRGTATVPPVGGLSEGEAKDAITKAGFNPKVTHEFSDTVGKGQVISQSPAPGTELTKGRQVNLVVSKGREGVAVPKLTGLSGDDAASQLKDLGLASKVTEQESSKEAGTVIAQDPPAGTTVDKGATVSLTVAKERPEVPDVSTDNPTAEDAQKELEQAGFKVKVKQDPTAPPEFAGLVVGQDPAPGERRSTGATVTITVGAEATPTPTPTP
jgi:serine/threonine-protein kinase